MMDGLVVLFLAALAVLAAAWLLVKGQTAPLDDEPPTLDTRNHLDDPPDG